MNDYNEKNKNNHGEKEKKTVSEKCTDKKMRNSKFVSFIAPFTTEKNIERFRTCGDNMFFVTDASLEHRKLHKANFCGNRFCPMCSWRFACEDSLEISILMEHLRLEENKEFIFITLTTPNVKSLELNNAIKNYNKSFERLMKRKEVNNITKGYTRKLEVTYQKERYITKDLWKKKKDYYKKRGLAIGDLEPNFDTYKPYFHVVIAVNKSYFNQTNQYIKQKRWLELWQEATGDDSITQVDVRKANCGDYKEIYEFAKYSAKDIDYLVSRPVFETFYNALKGKQVLVFSGLFKDAHAMYKHGKLDCYKKNKKLVDEMEVD